MVKTENGFVIMDGQIYAKDTALCLIATRAFLEATANSSSGNWIYSQNDAQKTFQISQTTWEEIVEEVAECLTTEFPNQVSDVECYEDDGEMCLDINLYTNFCLAHEEDDPENDITNHMNPEEYIKALTRQVEDLGEMLAEEQSRTARLRHELEELRKEQK